MGGQPQRHGAPADIDFRMMLDFLGDLGDPVHKIDTFHELIEFNGSGDCISLHFPLGDFFHVGGEFVWRKQIGHSLGILGDFLML